ncbi:terminase [Methylobacterium indicum]|uniref:terminase gpA endonuclease subunit n=1 Tax=Methylobacterium indicum TaxID=1775910 RepID=UPI000734DFDD|nr:terminase gpA endonuclease subunit [Methylobacterium indicum]KTS30845.1 terminase [Methylobacterium indicum]KTS41567.1 terminase [Methylobacterium indicum]KTS45182.1 terminase [Methylobacterium indicum]
MSRRLVPSRAAALFARAAGLCPQPRRTTPDQWGAANRVYPPSSGMPGPRDPYLTPFMIPFGRGIASRRYRRVLMACAAQIGKSETLLDVIGQRLDQAPAPILYVGPVKQFVTERWEPRVMALLDEAPTLAAKVARGKRMTKTRKVIAGVPLILAHAGSSTALKSDPFALALTDEADELMANVKGQGDPLSLIDKRGETFADFVHAIVSTPSEGRPETEVDPVSGLEFWTSREPQKIASVIWRGFLEGTRHHFAWQCPHCTEWFIPRASCLKIPDVEVREGKRASKRPATPAEARALAFFACPRCGCAIDETEKAGLNARGVMVAPGQLIEADGTVTGEPAPNETLSFWASGLCSPFATFADRAAELTAARTSGQHDRVQAVMNGGFGEVYAAGPLNAPKWETVRACIQPYKMGEVPREATTLVAGIDVQKLSLYVVLRGFGARGSSWLVSAEQLHGPTDSDEVWDALANVLTTQHGGLPVSLALIDSGYRPGKIDAGDEHRVYEFCRRWNWIAKPTKGRQTQSVPVIVKPHEVRADGKRPSYSLELVTVNTDYFKSLVHSRIATEAPRWGAFGVPLDVSEDYCRQMVSEVREIIGGKPVWTPLSTDNHYFDAETLCAVAGRLLNVERIAESASREWDPGAPPPLAARAADGTPDPEQMPPPSTPAAREKAAASLRDSLADRMASRAGRLHGRR